MAYILEIRAGEGGDESKLLVQEQIKLYARLQNKGRLDLQFELLEERSGFARLRVTGKDARRIQAEAGGHRFQRIPPTQKAQKKGLIHSSTITIAVLEEQEEADYELNMDDVEIRSCRGSGAGGQHRNVTSSAVQVTHVPTGISVRIEDGRSQHQNKERALEVLRGRLAAGEEAIRNGAEVENRRQQVGTAERSDKRRTIAVQRDQVLDHISGKTISAARYLKGDIDSVW